MADFFGSRGEKKVEYIELIYDLIFVYFLGRSNGLLHQIDGGFFTLNTYVTYLASTLAILQIWNLSTLFINRYGDNKAADYIFIFINMYLLYYMADGTRADWYSYYIRYNVAWGLILLNIAAQYFRIMKTNRETTPWEGMHLAHHMKLLLIQAGIVFLSIPVYIFTGFPVSWITVVVGFCIGILNVRTDMLVPVNMEHLTERVMLFVVFTFGEMIVGLAVYFTNSFSINTLYFSLLAFMIVVGLFMSYGHIYDHVVDRENSRMESFYLLLHIGLIVALNNITAALEFMRMPEVSEFAKNAFIVVSFLMYYFFLFFIGHYARPGCCPDSKFLLKLAGISAVFVVLMAMTYKNSWISIAVSVLYVASMYAMMHKEPLNKYRLSA